MSDELKCTCPDDGVPWHNDASCPVKLSELAPAHGPTSEASQIARRLCPNWMHPTGDAHYRDVKRELERLTEDRALLLSVIHRLLSSATPSQKENPAMFAAWAAAQSVLSNDQAHPQPRERATN